MDCLVVPGVLQGLLAAEEGWLGNVDGLVQLFYEQVVHSLTAGNVAKQCDNLAATAVFAVDSLHGAIRFDVGILREMQRSLSATPTDDGSRTPRSRDSATQSACRQRTRDGVDTTGFGRSFRARSGNLSRDLLMLLLLLPVLLLH